MESSHVKKCACADCNRSNANPSEWTVADYIVGLSDGKHYAMCGGCYEVSQFQDKTPDYCEWLGRSGKTEHVKVDNVCATCLVESKKLVSATGVLGFQADIPVCKGCKDYLDLNDAMLTYYERGWLDELYRNVRYVMRAGPTVEVVVYK